MADDEIEDKEAGVSDDALLDLDDAGEDEDEDKVAEEGEEELGY